MYLFSNIHPPEVLHTPGLGQIRMPMNQFGKKSRTKGIPPMTDLVIMRSALAVSLAMLVFVCCLRVMV